MRKPAFCICTNKGADQLCRKGREKIFRSSQRVKTVLYFQMNVKDRKAVATICVVLLLLNVQVNSYDHVETVTSDIVRASIRH